MKYFSSHEMVILQMVHIAVGHSGKVNKDQQISANKCISQNAKLLF